MATGRSKGKSATEIDLDELLGTAGGGDGTSSDDELEALLIGATGDSSPATAASDDLDAALAASGLSEALDEEGEDDVAQIMEGLAEVKTSLADLGSQVAQSREENAKVLATVNQMFKLAQQLAASVEQVAGMLGSGTAAPKAVATNNAPAVPLPNKMDKAGGAAGNIHLIELVQRNMTKIPVGTNIPAIKFANTVLTQVAAVKELGTVKVTANDIVGVLKTLGLISVLPEASGKPADERIRLVKSK